MVEHITADELNEQLGEDGPQVVDIRPASSFAAGHIPGAINVPYDELADRIADVEWGDEIVVACPIGESSLQAAPLLESYEGVAPDARIANLEGGYDAWEYELESE